MNNNEGRLSMAGDNLDEIRRDLLWDKIRTINSEMDEATFQDMRDMPIDEWVQVWMKAGINATPEDLRIVHEMLWPKGDIINPVEVITDPEELNAELDSVLNDDLTVTNNTPKEGTMATNEEKKNEVRNVNGIDVEIYVVNGIECVDKEDAKVLIGTKYDTDLSQQVKKHKIILVGQITRVGNAKKNVYSLASVLACKAQRHNRGTDAKERFEIEMYPDILALAVRILKEEGHDETQHIKDLIEALEGARNLTEERRAYNAKKEE